MTEHMVTIYEDANGELQTDPDTLHVLHGDQVVWKSRLATEYYVTGFSPQIPPLFSAGSIPVPANQTSGPITVQPDPAPGSVMSYKYSCVSSSPGGKVLDPIIIVDPPGR